jgi:putative transposase
MRDQSFINGEYYHVYNRGTDKRKIFLCQGDYERFIEGMNLFNSVDRVTHAFRSKLVEVSPRPEARLVEVVAYCLMSNHFHFLLKQVKDGGISKYIQKMLTGFTMYFNKRHERSGVLFQGVFKSKHINSDAYLLQVSRYIHLNPLHLENIHSKKIIEAHRFLQDYRWSSYGQYTGNTISNPPIEGSEIIIDQVGGKSKYKKFCISMVCKDYDWSRFRLDQD